MFSSTQKSLEVFRHIHDAIGASSTEDALLREVCEIFVGIAGYRMCWVGRALNNVIQSVTPIAKCGFEEDYLLEANIVWSDTERGRGPVGTAIRTKTPIVCKNTQTSPEFSPWRSDAVKRSYASLIAVPIIVSGDVFGAITIYSAEPDDFDTTDSHFITDFMHDIGEGIERIRYTLEKENETVIINLLLKSAMLKLSLVGQLEYALDVITRIEWLWVERKGGIFLFNKENNLLVMATQKNMSAEQIKKCMIIALGQCLCGKAALSKEILFSPQVDARHDITYDEMHAHGHYCVPITASCELIGLLTLYVADGYMPNHHELGFFATVANILSNLIEFRRKEEASHQKTNELALSNKFLYELFENMRSCVAVYRVSPDGGDFIFSGINLAAERLENIRREEVIGKNVVECFPGVVSFGILEVFRRVWRTGVAEHFPFSFYQDGRIEGWRDNYVYKLTNGEIVAVYDDVTEQKRSEVELTTRANTDCLTGLANRRCFLEQAEIAFERSVRHKKPLSLMMFDIDHFKRCNDEHGHAVGDTVIKRCADVARGVVRQIDVIGRIGGEEFCVLLPYAAEKTAFKVAERLRRKIEAMEIVIDDYRIRVTVSVGVATLRSGCQDVTVLLNRSDMAMYSAKRSGRNRVCIDTE